MQTEIRCRRSAPRRPAPSGTPAPPGNMIPVTMCGKQPHYHDKKYKMNGGAEESARDQKIICHIKRDVEERQNRRPAFGNEPISPGDQQVAAKQDRARPPRAPWRSNPPVEARVPNPGKHQQIERHLQVTLNGQRQGNVLVRASATSAMDRYIASRIPHEREERNRKTENRRSPARNMRLAPCCAG